MQSSLLALALANKFFQDPVVGVAPAIFGLSNCHTCSEERRKVHCINIPWKRYQYSLLPVFKRCIGENINAEIRKEITAEIREELTASISKSFEEKFAEQKHNKQ